MVKSLSSRFWPFLGMAFFALMIVAGARVSQPVVFALGVLGLVTGGISLVWNRLALEEVSYERHFPGHNIFKGEEISMTLAISNKKPVPLTWVRFEDEFPNSLEIVEGDQPFSAKRNVQILEHSTSMRWYEKLRWEYRLRCTQRGIHRIGPAHIESGDPFGFLRTRKTQGRLDSLLVYPRVVPLEQLGIPSARPLGETRGGLPIFEDPSRISGLRDYQRGDPIKIVDWKQSAKQRRLMVRTYDPSTSITVVLVVAVDTLAPYWAEYPPEELELVLTAAASMARYSADRQYTLGLFTNDMPILPNRPMAVPPARGRDQLDKVLTALATVRLFAFGPMSERLAEHSRRFPMGATIVLSTAFLPPEFVMILRDLKRRGYKIVVTYTGADPCPDLGEGIVVYQLREVLTELEEASELLAR
jgi:uncharacterized protein (DUF58 family)